MLIALRRSLRTVLPAPLVLTCLLGLSGATPAQQPAPELLAVRLVFADAPSMWAFVEDTSSYERLLSERPGTLADFLMTNAQLQRLHEAGTQYTELPAYHWSQVLQPAKAGDATSLPAFSNYTMASMVADLNAVVAAHPDVASLSVLAQGHDGNPVYVLKLSDNVAQREDEPRIYFQGTHHAGEAIGVDCTLAIVHYLLDNYGIDPTASAYVDENEIYVVPLANPDGWMKNEAGIVSGWRKNTRDNNGNGTFNPSSDGVDLNRNLSFNWGMAGSGNPGSSIYYGPAPLSEPEDLAIAALGASERFALTLTYHMSGEVVILPWTWQGQQTPDSAVYNAIGSTLAARIAALGTGSYAWYTAGDTGGYLDDHLYGWHGTLCYTVEVSASNTSASINAAVANNLEGAKFILERISGGQVTGLVTNAATGAPFSAKIEILEIPTSALGDRTSDVPFGRYRRILNDGTYTVRASTTQGFMTATLPGIVVNDAAGPTVADIALQPLESWIGGAPKLGSTISFNLDGIAGEGFYQFIGFETANIPLQGYAGALQVDPGALILLDSGALGGTGSNSIALGIPANPSIVGFEVFYQALTGPDLSGGLGHFTNMASITLF